MSIESTSQTLPAPTLRDFFWFIESNRSPSDKAESEFPNYNIKDFTHLVKESDSQGKTPLHEACRVNDKATVVWLLMMGAEINKRNKHGYTSIHFAVAYKAVDVLEVLISQAKKVLIPEAQVEWLNDETADQLTPLELAAMGGNRAIFKKLKKAGAVPTVANYETLLKSLRDQSTRIEKFIHYVGRVFGILPEDKNLDDMMTNTRKIIERKAQDLESLLQRKEALDKMNSTLSKETKKAAGELLLKRSSSRKMKEQLEAAESETRTVKSKLNLSQDRLQNYRRNSENLEKELKDAREKSERLIMELNDENERICTLEKRIDAKKKAKKKAKALGKVTSPLKHSDENR